MSRVILALCLIGLLGRGAYADSYVIPPDYHVTCLDAATGKVLWDTKPPKMGPPKLSIRGDEVIAESQIYSGNDEKPKRVIYRFNRNTGDLSKRSGAIGETAREEILPLQKLPRNLAAPDGTKFEYSPGNTRHLTTIKDGQEIILKRLDDYAYDLNIFGDLAIFTYSGGYVRDTYFGEVYAWSLKSKKLAWKFEPKRRIESLGRSVYTGIAVDGERVLVSTDQVLFALHPKSGKVLWETNLPRQKIRRYDSPWIRVGRVGEVLYMTCYEDLFALRAKDGKLIWSFDCGPFGAPWPTIAGGKAYVATRDLPPRKASTSK